MIKEGTHAVVAGRSVSLRMAQVVAALRDVAPEPVRDHYVEVGSSRYPVKQAFAAATGIDRADFTTNQARAILARAGMSVGRRSDDVAVVTSSAASSANPVLQERRERASRMAENLRPYLGRWVAVRDTEVVVAGGSYGEVVAALRERGDVVDGAFLVPTDPYVLATDRQL